MKTRHIASGIGSVIALVSAIGAVGCGADMGTEGASGEGAEIGSAEQAIRIDNACNGMISDLNDSNYAAKFPAYINLTSDEVLLFGGYDASGGAIDTVAKYNKDTGNWTTMTPLDTERGEPVVTRLSATRFLISGGQDTEGSAGTRRNDAEIYDTTANAGSGDSITLAGGGGLSAVLASDLVHHTVTPCGSAETDKWAVAGGGDASPASVDTLQVFEYKPNALSTSGFRTLVANGTATPVKLREAREFHAAYASSSNTVLTFAAGEASASGALRTSERLEVDADCDATNAEEIDEVLYLEEADPLPVGHERSQFAAAEVSLTVGINTFDLLLLGGKDTSGLPTDVIGYIAASDDWLNTGLDISVGRERPALAIKDSNEFALVGGDSTFGGTETSSAVVDYYDAGFTSSPSLCTPTIGGWAAYIDGLYIAGHGKNTTGPVYPTRPE